MKTSEYVTSNLIAASAGTGKTYKLALRFLALLMLDVPPEQIVALTFTRKAAGEFRDRILQCLAEGAADEAGAAKWAAAVRETWVSPYGYSLCCPKETTPAEKERLLARLTERHPLTQAAFCEKLQLVVNDMSRLHLSTLDGFFNTLVRLNHLELGLGKVSLLTEGAERDKERLRAFRQLFGSIAADDEATEGFLQLFSDFTDDGSQDLESSMSSMVNGFHDLFQNTENESVWGNLAAFPGLDFDPTLPPVHDEEWNALEEEVQQLVATGEKHTRAFGTFVRKMREHRFESMGTLERAMDALPASGSALARLQELAEPILRRVRNDVLRRTVYKTRGMHALLRLFSVVYDRNTRSAGKLEFSDITRQMPRLLEKDGAATHLLFRLDSQLKHWMLDEFQDTSPDLMNAIQPLLEEVAVEVAGAAPQPKIAPRSLFVVGDEKQSIYGFRGGTAELFRRFQERTPWKEAFYCTPMAKSYRSSAIIMKFVNKVFRTPAFSALYLPEGGFPHHETARDLQGCVETEAVPGETVAEITEAMCEAIGTRLDALWRYRMDVGILVHRNRHGRQIADWLAQHRPQIQVVLEGSDTAVAGKSPMGAMLMCFFRWLWHPADPCRLALLKASPLYTLVGETEQEQLEAWEGMNRLLQEQGYAAAMQEIIRRLTQRQTEELLLPEHRMYLQEWHAAATAFDAAGGSLEDWIHYMEELAYQQNAPKNVVRIMSIHKSKGLQFDAVILPLISDDSYANERHLTYMMVQDAQDRVQGILVPPAKYARAAWPAFQSYAADWRNKQIEESRNLLYVALTRAKCANYILLPGKAKTKDSAKQDKYTDSAVLLRALELEDAGGPEATGRILSPIGNPDWMLDNKYPLRNEAEALQPPTLLHLPPASAAPLRKVRPSGQEKVHEAQEEGTAEATVVPYGTDILPDARELAERGDPLEFGTAVHALFEQLVWLDAANAPAWLKKPANAAERLVAAALRVPEIRALFDAAAYPAGSVVYNEQSVEAVEGEDWISACIDRLVLRGDGTALIIDYKTNVHAEQLEETYRGQMTLYRRLVHGATGIPEEKIDVLLAAVGCRTPHLVPCRL